MTVSMESSSDPVCASGDTGSLLVRAQGGSGTGFIYIVRFESQFVYYIY